MHLVRAGGGFGRRLHSEYDIEVSKIARLVADERAAAGQPSVPVKLLWSARRRYGITIITVQAVFHYFKGGCGCIRQARPLSAISSPALSRRGTVVPQTSSRADSCRISGGLRHLITPFNIPTGALRAPGTNGVSFVMQWIHR